MENKNEDTNVVNLTGGSSQSSSLEAYPDVSSDPQALSMEPNLVEVTTGGPMEPPTSPAASPWIKRGVLVLVGVALIAGLIWVLAGSTHRQASNLNSVDASSQYGSVDIPLGPLSASGVDFSQAQTVGINGTLEINGALTVTPSLQPASAKPGQIYYDKNTNLLAYYNGSQFIPVGPGVSTVGGFSGQISLGAGLVAIGGQLGNTGVLSFQGQTGDVSLNAGTGISVNGTTITNKGVISVTSSTPALTVTDDGNGNLTLTGSGSGTVASLGGTTDRLAKFTGAQLIGDSLLGESGTTITVNGDLSVTGGVALANALTVANGGTGTTALTANGVVIGQGTAALATVTSGGAGLCLLSTVGAPVFAACPSGSGVSSLNGLTGAISIANASGAGATITIDNASTVAKGIASFNATNFSVASGAVNTIQNINTGATPTFAGVNTNTITPSAPLTIGVSAQTALLQGSTTTITSSGVGNNIVLNSAGTIELQDTTNVSGNITSTGDLAVNGGDITAAGTLNITAGGTLTAGDSTHTLTLQGDAATTLKATSGAATTIVGFVSPTANTTLNFPAVSAGTYTICVSSGNCSGAASTLQSAYDNSTSPEIVLDATRGALTIRDTLAGLGASLLEVQNNAGSTTYLAVTAAGVVVTGTAVISGNINSTSGVLQTAGTTRVDNSGNLTNIATITASGNATLQGGSVTLGTNAQAGSVIVSDGSNNTGTIQTAALGQNTVYTLPDPGAGAATICLNTGNCAGTGGGVTTAGGTTNQVAKFTGSQTIGDSLISDNGTTVSIAGILGVNTLTPTGALTIGATSQSLTLQGNASTKLTATNAGITNSLQFAAPATSNKTVTIPNASGTVAVSASGVIALDANGNITCPTCAVSGSGVTSVDGLTGALTIANSSGVGTTITIDDASTVAKGIASFNATNFSVASGAVNTIQNIHTGASPTFVGLTLSGNATVQGGSVTVGTAAQGGSLILSDGSSNIGTVQTAALGQNTVYTLPDPGGAAASICLTTGNCANAGGGVTTSGGTTNQIPKFTGSQTIGDSLISDNGSTVTIAGILGVNTITPTGALTIGATSQSLTLQGNATTKLTATSGGITNTLQFAAPASSNKTITLPNASGTVAVSASGVIALDANGNITCPTCAVSGSGVTSVDALTGALTIANSSGVGTTITLDDASTVAKGIASFNATNFSVTSGAVNTIQNINTGASPTFTGLTLSGNATIQGGSATLGTTSQAGSLLVSDGSSNTGTIQTAALGQDTVYTLPDPGSGTVSICLTTGNCAGTGGGVTGTGTNNRLAKFTSTGSTIGDSSISDSGTVVTASGDLVIQGGDVTVGVANSQTGTIAFADGGTAFLGSLVQGALAASRTYTLPDATGTICLSSGNCLGGGGGGANTSLSNLTSVAINTSLLPGSTSIDLGSNAAAFRDLYLGGTVTNNFRFTGTASAARTITLDDLSGHLALVQTAGSSSAQTGDLNVSGTLIAGTALQGTLVKSADGAGASSAITLRSGTTTGGSGLSTGLVSIQSGDGSGTNTSSGNVAIDSGAKTGSGTTGTVSVGGTNASAVTLGHSGVTTTNGGALAVTQLLTANGGASVAANQNLTLQNGSGVFAQTYTSNSASSAQTLSATNSNAGGSSVAVNGQDITLVGTATSGGINTNSAIRFENPSAAANNLFYGLNFAGTGFTDVLRVNGTQIINGSGVVQSPAISGNYSGITGVGTLTSGALGSGFTTIAVGQGGTGATSFTSNGVLYGNGAGAVQATAAGTNGQCLTGNTGSAPTWVTCTGLVTLQNAYNNATNPEIVVDATRGALTVRDASSPIGANLFEVQSNGGGTTYFGVDASGASVGGALTVSGTATIQGANSLTLGTTGSNTGAALFKGSTAASGTITLKPVTNNPGTHILSLPDEDGTLCSTGSVCTGYQPAGSYAPASGSANYIQNQIAGAQTADFYISGTGRAATLNGTTGINTGAVAGTQRIDASGNLVNIGTITSGLINGQTISSTANLTGTLVVQGSGVTIGTTLQQGSLVLHDGNGQTATISVGSALVADTALAIPTAVGGSDTFCLLTLANCTGGTVSSIGVLDSQTKSANGAVISGNSLVLQTADASFPGLVSTGTQIFAGAKTFNGVVTLAGGVSTGDLQTASGAAPNNLKVKAGDITAANGTGATLNLYGGDSTSNSCATACVGGDVVIQGGAAPGVSGTHTGGSVSINGATANNTNGSVNIGNTSALVNIGSTSVAGTVSIQNATAGTIKISDNGTASTVQIGNTTGAVTQNIRIGNNATASSTNNVTLGSTIGSSTTTIQGGSGNVNVSSGGTIELQSNTNVTGTLAVSSTITATTLGTANTSTYLCRNASNQIATCSTGASGSAFIQGGNNFGATAVLGTTGANDLTFIRNNATQITVGASAVTLGSNINLTLQGATARISNAQGQTNSEAFGAGATVSSNSAVAVGANATASNDDVAIGFNATGATNSVAIGSGAVVSQTGIAIGHSAAAGFGAVAIGASTSAPQGSITIGGNATAAGNNQIAIGYSAATTADNQLVIGGSTVAGSYITQAYLGSGITDATPQSVVLHATGGNGTNIAGAGLTLAGGISTGTGNGGAIALQVSAPGTTGSSANSLASVLTLSGSTGNALFKNAVNSASALQIQNAAGTETMLSVDTTARSGSGGNLIKVGNSTGTDTALTILQLDSATADPTTNLAALNGGLFYNSTTNKVSLIENGQVKIICNTTDLGCGTGTVTLQTAYTNSTSPEITVDATRGAVTLQDASSPIGANLFEVQSNGGGTKYFAVAAGGITTVGTATQTYSGTSDGNTMTFTSTSGTQTNGVLVNRNGASGTTTNGINVTQTAGTLTNGLAFTGTIGTDINRGSGTLTLQGTGGVTITAGTTNTVSIDSAGAGTTSLGAAQATTINVGSSAPTAARTITIGGGNAGFVDTINVGTGAGTVAGAKTVHIADGTPTGSGTNLVTIGSISAAANTTTIQGGNGAGAVSVQAAASGTISIGTTNANVITVGSTASTSAITIGQSTASQTIGIGTGTTAAGNILTVNIANSATSTGKALVTIGNTNDGSSLTLQAGTANISLLTTGNVTVGTSDTTGTLLVLDTKTDYTNHANSSSEPTGVAGGMYYNSALGQFRCYEVSFWRDCMESARTSRHYISDMESSQPDNSIDFNNSGNGGAAGSIASVTGHPGIVTLGTGTGGANSWVYAGSRSTNNDSILLGNGDYWRYETSIQMPVLSTSAQRFMLALGFTDFPGDATDGCYFRYSDNINTGKWQGVCRSGGAGSEVTCDALTTVAINTWYRLTVVVNAAGTSVDFQINGTSKCQITSSIPTTATHETAWADAITKNIGTTDRFFDIDYIDVLGQFGSAR